MPQDPQIEPKATEEAVSFVDFILSLATNALVHLETEGDQTPHRSSLAIASQHIDILAMLEVKTRGNLEESEEKLLKSLVYDLRMKFLEAQKH